MNLSTLKQWQKRKTDYKTSQITKNIIVLNSKKKKKQENRTMQYGEFIK